MEKQNFLPTIDRLNKTIDALNDIVKRLTKRLDAQSKSNQLLEKQIIFLIEEVQRLRKENEKYKNLSCKDDKKPRSEEEKDWDDTDTSDDNNNVTKTEDSTSCDRYKVTVFRKLMHVNFDDKEVKEMDFGYMLPGVICLE